MKRVLHVEDEEDIREVARLALEDVGGLFVRTAGSGPMAISMLRDYTPDIILLDVMMPGMDGVTLFQELKRDAKTASIPVIFMTAKVQSDEVDRYKRLGALGVIAKPFDPMTLAAQVCELWRTHGAAIQSNQ